MRSGDRQELQVLHGRRRNVDPAKTDGAVQLLIDLVADRACLGNPRVRLGEALPCLEAVDHIRRIIRCLNHANECRRCIELLLAGRHEPNPADQYDRRHRDEDSVTPDRMVEIRKSQDECSFRRFCATPRSGASSHLSVDMALCRGPRWATADSSSHSQAGNAISHEKPETAYALHACRKQPDVARSRVYAIGAMSSSGSEDGARSS